MKLYLYHIDELIEMRAIARENKDWVFCDDIRNYLDTKGVIIMDTKHGQEIYCTNKTRDQLIKKLNQENKSNAEFDAWLYTKNIQKINKII